jgi:hypothetical protein
MNKMLSKSFAFGLASLATATFDAPAAHAVDLACCCNQNCPEGNAGCFVNYFESTCDSANSCIVGTLTPTTDPSQVHPFWFLYDANTGRFSGFEIQCYDISNW